MALWAFAKSDYLDNPFPSLCSKLNIIKRPSKDNRSATAYLAGGVPISPNWEVLSARLS
jgi:hypothetical protein